MSVIILAHLFLLFFLNYLADYLAQSREMGQKKSTDMTYLLAHTSIICLVIFVGMSFVLGIDLALKLAFLNAATHFVVDLISWNLYSLNVIMRYFPSSTPREIFNNIHYYKKELAGFEYWKDEKFYWTIGADCHTHLFLLILCYFYIVGPFKYVS